MNWGKFGFQFQFDLSGFEILSSTHSMVGFKIQLVVSRTSQNIGGMKLFFAS